MSRARVVLLFAVTGIVAAMYVVAPNHVASRVAYDVVSVALIVAVWSAAAASPDRWAMRWLAAGLTCWAVGDLVWDAYSYLGRERPDVSLADVWYLAGYPAIAVGVGLLVAARGDGDQREGFLDGLAFATAAAIACWQFLVVPSTVDATLLQSIVWGAYPFADVLLLAAMTWLVLSPGGRTSSNLLLGGFLAVTFVADIAYTGLPLWVPSFDVGHIDGVYGLSYAVLVLAVATSRGEVQTVAAEGDGPRRMHPARLVLLGAALLTAPAIAVAGASSLSSAARTFLFCSSLVLAATVLYRFLIAVRDREAAHDELAHRAAHDDLTGLYNRPLLMERVQQSLDRAGRLGRTTAVLYVDLDRFKPINDTWGHAAGDMVLAEVAERLRTVTRPGDVVARVGGDEFVIVCDDVATANDANAVAARIVDALSQAIEIREGRVFVSASVGVTLVAGGGEAGQVIRDADAAMYRAKQRGRNRFEQYDDALHAIVERRAAVEAGLRSALQRGEIELHFQPVVAAVDGTLVGFESLVRWRRDGRLVDAATFMDVAEESGLIVPIGMWVVDEACRQLRRWNEMAPDRRLWIAVNVSPRQFADARFVEQFAAIVDDTGADASLLVVEITESVLVEDVEQTARQLRALSNLGARIAVDDFGTGYSALAYLRHFPVDIVKIDRQFLREVGSYAPSSTMVAAVVHLAHMLGHTVVAEGVETDSQAEAIRTIECDFGQGYYFGRPQPAFAYDEWVAGSPATPLPAAG